MKRTTVKKSVSFPPDLLVRAVEKAKADGFQNSLSAYLQKLVRKDTEKLKAK